MNKPFIKKKFKEDVESDDEPDMFAGKLAELEGAQTIVAKYIADQLDFEAIETAFDESGLAIEMTVPKLHK